MLVCINGGHCPGIDPGAVGPTGLQEADVAKYLMDKTAEYLTAAGVVVITVQDDSLQYICDIANNNRCDAFISIHCNSAESPQANGTEIFTSRGTGNKDKLATCIMNQISATFPQLYVRSDYTDGDVDKEAGFYVLNYTNMPACLIETAFISNPNEEAFLRDEHNLDEMAKAIARGLTDYQIEVGI